MFEFCETHSENQISDWPMSYLVLDPVWNVLTIFIKTSSDCQSAVKEAPPPAAQKFEFEQLYQLAVH